MPDQLLDFGLQTAQGALGAGMGLMLEKHNDKRQLKQQGKLQQLEISGQQQMTDYNMAKQLEMWKKTNYSAQMEQMKQAGINPGLIYGMSGGGATVTGNATGSVHGTNAPTGGGEAIAMSATTAQLGLMRAQKELIEAQTKNELAAVPVKEATVPNIEASTDSLRQGINNQKAAEELTKIETTMKSIDVKMANETYEQRVDTIIALADQAKNIYDRMSVQLDIDRATKQARINTLRTQAVEAILKNALITEQTKATTSGIKVNDQQIKKMAAEILQGWDRNDIEAFSAELRAQFPGLGATIGGQINGALEELRELIKDKGRDRTYKVDRPNRKP